MLSPRERKKYLREMRVDPKTLKRIKEPEEKKQIAQGAFTVYHPNFFGKIANKIVPGASRRIEKSFPLFAKNSKQQLRMADIKMLSQTYLNTMVLAILLVFCGSGAIVVIVGKIISLPLLTAALFGVAIGAALAIFTGILMALYPTLVVKKRSHQIKNELPFAIIHMATIAGSGAEPMALFRLLLNAGEYKGLESDIKRIVNYVNLFGYDISTALKSVASTTPSKEWKDVLTGITTTIESGGSLKSYLKSMADGTMNSYRLERKKYVETLATYSDIYTAILIAAPLLFIVTLAIINILGGTIGGVTVNVLANIGTYGVIPLLNLGFIVFLNLINPEK